MKVKVRHQKNLHVKTEMALCALLHVAGIFLRARPKPFINMAWSCGEERELRRLYERLQTLKQDGYIDDEEDTTLNAKVYRMTDYGRLIALGGVDPTLYWDSTWDGKWRLVSFDVPEKRRCLRHDLRETLRANHFGRLQRSLWVTPHPLGEELQGKGLEVSSLQDLFVMEGVLGDGASDEDVVAEAWKFSEINALYKKHWQFLKSLPKKDAPREKFFQWIEDELFYWKNIVARDPFLPRCLLPKGYLGEEVWNERLKVLRSIHKLFPKKISQEK